MKRVIDGKVYDTDTADVIAERYHGKGSDGYFEILFRTPKGRFFLGGAGGAASPWAESVETGGCTYSWCTEKGGYVIEGIEGIAGLRALSESEALGWCERNNVKATTIQKNFAVEEG